uniref:IlKSL2 n=1 Tax=Isodon lophanthoides var. gerardianus TaxID=669302 RepID=A0A8F6T6I7_9LAMI|nr:IlKSL2 [Isodon lophanthoides var. gerardianus]
MFSSTLKLKINPFLDNKIHRSSSRDFRGSRISNVKCSLNNSEDLIVKVRERVKGKVEISPSAYDTAWVAMVPAREYSGRKPRFPECLDWIVENQNSDGSWGVQSPSLLKHSLSCTLACLLPLSKWNVSSPQLLRKGVEFIRSSASAATDKDQITPIGFEIIFPMMIKYASDLNLELPINQDLVHILFRNRDTQLTRNTNFEYVGEGLGNSVDWKKMISMHQRSNGSLFNSPATTAAALIHRHDEKCLEYLNSLLTLYKTWVPTIHPVDVYTRLCLVDHLQGLGVERFVQPEIETVLHDTFRLWQQKDDEIFADATCRAMAFRLLRLQGYPVTPDELAAYVDEESFLAMASFESSGTDTVLELYKASEVRLPEDDDTLEKLHDWTSKFLKQQLQTKTILDQQLQRKVEFNLKNHRGILHSVKHRQNIDLYDIDYFRLLKTAYRCPTVYNEDIFQLSAQNFMASQAETQKELQMLLRWYDDLRLDMEFGRNVSRVAHFLASNSYPDPQLSEARLAFAKTVILVTRFDDFFDHHGSREESALTIELIREWNEPSTISYPSEEVEILYSALHATLTDMAEKAYPVQGRCIKSLLIFLWIELLTCFKSEMDSCTVETPPNFDEYMEFAWITIGSRISVLVSIHFANVKLSEETVRGSKCTALCHQVSSVARLLNDLQTYKKERDERKINSVIILMNSGKLSEEEAVSSILKTVDHHRKELLKLVVQREGSMFPRAIMDVFLRPCPIAYYLYTFTDEFTAPQQMKQDMKLLFHQPLHPSLVC